MSTSKTANIKLQVSKRNANYELRFSYCSILSWNLFARRQNDEYPNYGVLAEAGKLLAIISFEYQMKDCRQQTGTKYVNDEKTNRARKGSFLEKLDYVDN